MNRSAFTILPTESLRKLESDYIKACNDHAGGQLWGVVLMELAGRTAALEAIRMYDESRQCNESILKHHGTVLKHNEPVFVFCGPGNNGGDGLVIARYLALRQVPVRVIKILALSGHSHEFTVNETLLSQLAQNSQLVSMEEFKIDQQLSQAEQDVLSRAMENAPLIVDALFGTGLTRELQGICKTVIQAINNSGSPVLAVDIASGINSDNGQVMGVAIKANRTVTFGCLKPGLLLYPGYEHCGELKVVDIGLPQISSWYLTTASLVKANLPARPADSNKGTFGRLLTIAGSRDMPGASHLATKSALRVGTGLQVLAAPKSMDSSGILDEVIHLSVNESELGTFNSSSVEDLLSELNKASSILLGPGISLNDETIGFVQTLLPHLLNSGKPCLIDADGLNALAKIKVFKGLTSSFVLTPHPKELSRLLGKDVESILEDRIVHALEAAQKFSCTVVLKGAHTIIAGHEGQVYINPTGNAGMATAGSGDVLSGIIAGFLCQGLEPLMAAVAGTYLHGLAGDLASGTIGNTGTIASDFTQLLPKTIELVRARQWRSKLEETISG